ncbi:MAG: hypothetical protein KatS3mg032_1504 [Cyclobacteriaceae bacterium]|nr:MAG: hypothetical protein KatS3mg032_1504 [Cyclobacteriaceae bacterium]
MLWLLWISWISWHPIHVSVTDMVYDEQERELEITMRLFTDDLELSVRNVLNEPELDLLNPGRGRTTAGLVKDYIMKRFSLTLDGRPLSLRFLGMEQEAEVVVCYIQARDIKRWRAIEVVNTVIMETYDDQSNLVHLTVQGTVRSHRLTPKQQKGTFLRSAF